MHLDKLRWNSLILVSSFLYGLFGLISQLFHDNKYLFAVCSIGLIVTSVFISQYNKIIRKFVAGQDYVSLLLANIEERNQHIFCNEIYSPKEGKEYISFFSRRKHVIKRNHKNSKKSDLTQKEYRGSDTVFILVKGGSIIVLIGGILFLIMHYIL